MLGMTIVFTSTSCKQCRTNHTDTSQTIPSSGALMAVPRESW